eukprot:SAG22_NODE_3053_length_1982_cov_1.775890_2_plen_416_part_00
MLAAQTIRRAGGHAKPTFPYIQWSMPQAWYEHQAHFNDPTPQNQAMWLKDSSGVYLDAHNASGAAGLNEGGDPPQPWRRLYDWRVPATREFFIKQVLGWVIDSPDLSGAFFDDVNAIATGCIYGIDGVPAANASGKTNAFGRCGNWTAADAATFQAATVQTVKEVLAAFAAAGKWPLLSIRQDGTINQPLRDFQAAVNPLLAPHGAFRFMEALCQQYTMPCTLDGVSSNASACCVSQVEELVAQSAAGVPLAVHGWGEKHVCCLLGCPQALIRRCAARSAREHAAHLLPRGLPDRHGEQQRVQHLGQQRGREGRGRGRLHVGGAQLPALPGVQQAARRAARPADADGVGRLDAELRARGRGAGGGRVGQRVERDAALALIVLRLRLTDIGGRGCCGYCNVFARYPLPSPPRSPTA